MSVKTLVTAVLATTIAVLSLLTLSCGQAKEASGKIGVVVTISPQADFVAAVGGDKVDITVMVPPGASPHTYEPTPSQMKELARAKIYAKVGSGIEFELSWMDKLIALNRQLLVVDCSEGIRLIPMGVTDGQKPGGAMDPHIWMSPLNVKIMVKNISDGLIKIDANNQAYYEKNRDVYLQNLTKLDQDIREVLSRPTRRRVMVYHDAFGYFARDYNLTVLPIEEEGKEPTAADIARLIEQARQDNIKVIFMSPEFNPASAKVVAEAIGGRVVFINPLARDYLKNMRILLDELVKVMD